MSGKKTGKQPQAKEKKKVRFEDDQDSRKEDSKSNQKKERQKQKTVVDQPESPHPKKGKAKTKQETESCKGNNSEPLTTGTDSLAKTSARPEKGKAKARQEKMSTKSNDIDSLATVTDSLASTSLHYGKGKEKAKSADEEPSSHSYDNIPIKKLMMMHASRLSASGILGDTSGPIDIDAPLYRIGGPVYRTKSYLDRKEVDYMLCHVHKCLFCQLDIDPDPNWDDHDKSNRCEEEHLYLSSHNREGLPFVHGKRDCPNDEGVFEPRTGVVEYDEWVPTESEKKMMVFKRGDERFRAEVLVCRAEMCRICRRYGKADGVGKGHQ